jgi:hypothetical protein
MLVPRWELGSASTGTEHNGGVRGPLRPEQPDARSRRSASMRAAKMDGAAKQLFPSESG